MMGATALVSPEEGTGLVGSGGGTADRLKLIGRAGGGLWWGASLEDIAVDGDDVGWRGRLKSMMGRTAPVSPEGGTGLVGSGVGAGREKSMGRAENEG